MSELYPSDNDLNALSGTSDVEQGVAYPTIFESPYYTTFYKMLYRLLDVARRAGDLRVCKDGDLTFEVKAGRYFNSDTAVDCAAASAQSLTDDATNYIYLTAAGVLTVSTTGFPTPSVTPHIPLAAIATGSASAAGVSGEYNHEDITDYRGRGIFSVCGAGAGNLNSLDWQESVADELDFTSAEPAAPTLGDRYLNTGSGASSETGQTVAANDIEEWNGTTWTEITPTEGNCCLVEDRDMLIGFNGSLWVDIGTFALLNEAKTFFAATDITGAEAETLTDLSNADTLHVHSTAGLAALCVTAAKLAADAVETAKIKDLNVTEGKLAALAVTAAKLAADAVETAKVKDGAVTAPKIIAGIEAKTSAYEVQVLDRNKIFTNEGATAEIAFTFHADAIGPFTFIISDSDGLKLTAPAGKTIRVVGEVSIAAGYVKASTVGNAIKVIRINSTEFIATDLMGTWTVETS